MMYSTACDDIPLKSIYVTHVQANLEISTPYPAGMIFFLSTTSNVTDSLSIS